MELNIVKEQNKSIIEIDGEMTIYEVTHFKDELLAAFADSTEIEIDLACAGTCDTASFQVLMGASKNAQAKNIIFRLVNPQEQFIHSVNTIGCDWKCLNVN